MSRAEHSASTAVKEEGFGRGARHWVRKSTVPSLRFLPRSQMRAQCLILPWLLSLWRGGGSSSAHARQAAGAAMVLCTRGCRGYPAWRARREQSLQRLVEVHPLWPLRSGVRRLLLSGWAARENILADLCGRESKL